MFDMREGLSLELRRVSNYKIAQFQRAYSRHNPKPEPPLIEIKIAGKLVARQDYNDDGFRIQQNEYAAYMRMAQYQYMVGEGVLTEPPPEFTPDPRLVIDETPEEYKLLWIYDLIEGDDAILNDLMEAISSIGEATQTAIEDAEKNSEPEN